MCAMQHYSQWTSESHLTQLSSVLASGECDAPCASLVDSVSTYISLMAAVLSLATSVEYNFEAVDV